jgi:hypothetical protein
MASGYGRIATEAAAAGRSAFNEAGSPRRSMRVTRSSASSSGFDERRESRADSRSTSWSTYLAQHDVQAVTIEKLRYLLSKATAVFG